MPKKMMWSLGIPAIILAFVGVSTPAIADTSTPGDGYTAPAPTKVDPSGTDQDQYCIPTTFFDHPIYGGGLYRVNDVSQVEGCHSTEGASSITITTSYNSGTWTFDYNDESGSEAPNTYTVEVGSTCYMDEFDVAAYREVVAYANNGDDATEAPFSIWPEVTDVRGEINVVDTEIAYDIPDGTTAAMRIMEFESRIPGLRPGRYLVKFWQAYSGEPQYGAVVKQMHFTVPKCGDTTGDTGRKASGALRAVGCKAVKVTANAVRYNDTPTAAFRVYRHARGHRGHKRNILVSAGSKRVVVLHKPARRSVVFTLKVKQPTGWKWLDTQGVPRCR